MQKKKLLIITIIVMLILLIPFIAMQFTTEVNWGLMDFIVAGFLLFSLLIFLDLAARKVEKPKYRITVLVIIVLAFFLVWAELAVGIFGTPFAGD